MIFIFNSDLIDFNITGMSTNSVKIRGTVCPRWNPTWCREHSAWKRCSGWTSAGRSPTC